MFQTVTLLRLGVFLWASSDEAAPSPVAPADPYVNNACVRCHQDLAGRLGEIALLEWKNSVHHANSVGCDGCHGGDASLRREQFDSDEAFKNASHLNRDTRFLAGLAESRQFVSSVRGREVSYFCGKCHAMIKEKHLGSPHGDYGDPSCLYCHARTPDGRYTHEIHAASLDIIDTRGRSEQGRCSACHREATMQAVAQIKESLAKTSQLIDTTSTRYQALLELGYRSLELQGLQEHGQEVQSRLRRVFHSFDMREISNFSGEIKALADRTDRTYDLLQQLTHTRRTQTVIGLSVCAFLLCFVLMLLYYLRFFCERHGSVLPHPKSG